MSKETYISYIVELIRNECFTTANSAFNFHLTDPKRPKPTKGITQFKQYWKIAQERYKEAQFLIEKEKAELYKAKEIEAKKASILNREQVLEMASNVVKLAYNKVAETKGKDKEVYAFASALEKYNKLNGFDAPNKNETLIKGVDVIEIIRNEDKN